MENKLTEELTICPTCAKPMNPVQTTKTGKKLQRCSGGSWNPDTKKNEGCDFVKWLEVDPVQLDETCPKCGAPLVMAVTRFGKKMKKCSTNSWDKEKKQAIGCDYIEWINGTSEPLDEDCPTCGEKLVFFTTSSGKKMKKCSTAGWDREKRQATGCAYVYWFKPGELPPSNADTGEENLPPLPPDPYL